MFEFFKHSNVGKPESETVSFSEVIKETPTEADADGSVELFYVSPEYKSVEAVYELVGPEEFFVELNEQIIEKSGFYEGDWGADLDAVDSEEEVKDKENPVEKKEESVIPYGMVVVGNKLLSAAAALTLAFTACNKKTEVEASRSGVEHTASSHNISEKAPGSTLVKKGGAGTEVFEKYSKEILPSGDIENGFINLNDTTADAVAAGALKPFSNLEIYSLEGAKKPSVQGIPFKSIWILKMSEGKIPRPLIGGNATFKSYCTKSKKGALEVTPAKMKRYREDVAASVSRLVATNEKGEFSQSKYKKIVDESEKFAHLEIEAILEFQNASPAEKAALVQKWVKPYQGRTGTTKSK
ncbi:MAG: hypothetical protein WCQ00_01070 [bacterium]